VCYRGARQIQASGEMTAPLPATMDLAKVAVLIEKVVPLPILPHRPEPRSNEPRQPLLSVKRGSDDNQEQRADDLAPH
jgi:hypothetical protein